MKKAHKMLKIYLFSFLKSFLTRNSTLFNNIQISFYTNEKENIEKYVRNVLCG